MGKRSVSRFWSGAFEDAHFRRLDLTTKAVISFALLFTQIGECVSGVFLLTSLNGFIFDCMIKGNLHSSHEFVSEAVSHWIKQNSCTYRRLPLHRQGVSNGLILSDSWQILQKSPLVWLVWLELDPNLKGDKGPSKSIFIISKALRATVS